MTSDTSTFSHFGDSSDPTSPAPLTPAAFADFDGAAAAASSSSSSSAAAATSAAAAGASGGVGGGGGGGGGGESEGGDTVDSRRLSRPAEFIRDALKFFKKRT